MSTGKRALIVDDSRSARVILSRMLEQHGLGVDTAESAEQALDYLKNNRPDVIFMDHLMPGMDGFEAVKLIKTDPQTATVPLMMYTSQEGELYVSQARALGAMGVLPKTVRPVDVARVLYQLNLLPDRRAGRSPLFEEGRAVVVVDQPGGGTDDGLAAAIAGKSEADAVGTGVPGVAHLQISTHALAEMQAGLRQTVNQLVRDQLAEQRRFMLASFEAFARRINNEMREGLSKAAAAQPRVVEPIAPPPRAPSWLPALLTAGLAALPALMLGALYWKSLQTNRAMTADLARVRNQSPAGAGGINPLDMPSVAPTIVMGDSDAKPTPTNLAATERVAYGQAPFAGARLERLRTIVTSLQARKFRGTVQVESHVGDFCLTGDAGSGYSLADPESSMRKCDVMGNPFDESLSPVQRLSVEFANFVAAAKQQSGGALTIEVIDGSRRAPVQFVDQNEKTTAGDVNKAATANNRVEFRVIPSAS